MKGESILNNELNFKSIGLFTTDESDEAKEENDEVLLKKRAIGIFKMIEDQLVDKNLIYDYEEILTLISDRENHRAKEVEEAS